MKVTWTKRSKRRLSVQLSRRGSAWLLRRLRPVRLAIAHGRLSALKAEGDRKWQQLGATLAVGDNVGRLMRNASLIETMYVAFGLPPNNAGLRQISAMAAFSRSLGKGRHERRKLPYMEDMVCKDVVDVLECFRKLEPQANPCYWLALMRPLMYWDVQVKDSPALGRLVFEMYTECSPELVWDFVRTSAMGYGGFFKFLKLNSLDGLLGEKQFPLRMFGALQSMPAIQPDQYLSHGSRDGILSVCKYAPDRFEAGFLLFALSFKRNAEMDGYCYPIGCLVDGMEYIKSLAQMAPALLTGMTMVGCGCIM